MEATGIKVVNPEQQISAAFKKEERLVVTTEEQYPQHIMIEFLLQDKCDLLKQLISVGETSKSWHQFKRGEWLVLRAKPTFSIIEG
jgi:hypothetical protein